MALKANQTLVAFDFLLISPMSQRQSVALCCPFLLEREGLEESVVGIVTSWPELEQSV